MEGCKATPSQEARLAAACAAWDARDGTRRLADRDATLWTGGDEPRWLDWLDLGAGRACARAAGELREAAVEDGLDRVLLVGMGGSSLCPEVLSRVHGPARGGLPLTVLDTIDPDQLNILLRGVDPARALVVVASKSGSTLEPSLVKDLLRSRLPGDPRRAARRHLVAITDPGSALHAEATREGWRAIVPGVPGIGGRYSALSPFGIVPAALLGVDVDALLAHAEAMRARCLAEPAHSNPGVGLGVALGSLALEGRDKLTLIATRTLRPVGAWIEQLVAESTGKWGRGILPVDLEPARLPEACGEDRVFVSLRLGTEQDRALDAHLAKLGAAGHPVLCCDVPDVRDLGALFYQWEIATAVAGAILGIHPFDQPDVEAAKAAARARLSGEEGPDVAERVVLARQDGVILEADARIARTLLPRLPDDPTLQDVLDAHLGRERPPRWIGILAWRVSDPSVTKALGEMRRRLSRQGRLATTLGIGPRFLHSTGQFHKGGPATGTFLQVMGPASGDLSVPGRDASLGSVLAAQAEGDFDVLSSRGRRALMIRLEDAGRAPRALLAAIPGDA